MISVRRKDVDSVHIRAPVAECGKQKTMLRHSHLIISAHRAKSTDQKTVYFLRFSLTHLVAPFHRHIIIPLEHINAIGITGQISLPYVLIKREKLEYFGLDL